MADEKERRGACLCGAVRISVKASTKSVGACHCSMCRKWGGGPLLAVECGHDVHFEGGDRISVFNSSDWAERGFCSRCGSHLFYRASRKKDTTRFLSGCSTTARTGSLTNRFSSTRSPRSIHSPTRRRTSQEPRFLRSIQALRIEGSS
jgi:hypothetical protein